MSRIFDNILVKPFAMDLYKIILVVLLILPSFCFSQKMFLPMDSVIKRSPIIIEGKVINVTPPYWNTQTKSSRMHEPFRSFIIQVYKVFKGKLKQKYVEIPIVGGEIGNTIVTVSDNTNMPDKGNAGIFYLEIPSDPNWSKQFYNSGDTLANHYILQPFYDPYNYDALWSRPQIYLQDKETNLYQHIEKLTGRKRKIISNP